MSKITTDPLCKESFNGAGHVVNMLQTSDETLDKYIGKFCEFKKFSGITFKEAEKKEMCGWGYAGKHKIMGVQKLFGGRVGFRVINVDNDEDTFGRCARLEDINVL